MRKLFLSIIALTLGIGAWAQTQSVNYIDTNGQLQRVTATVITNSASILDAGWYVVLGNDVQTNTLTCRGAVNLILADGAKLTARGGEGQAAITVSGDGNSLTIYGQAAQSGQLIATGGKYAAGIGGGFEGSGSNITINGGIVTANGGNNAAGIGGGDNCSGSNITINGGIVTANGRNNAAGIGGGYNGSGSNITINGGTVTANGWENAAGIGSGRSGSSSNIKVNADCHVFADGNNPPTTEIAHDSDTDLASALSAPYAFIEIDQTILSELRAEAIAAIDKAVEGVANDEILAIAREAKNKIMNANGRIVITAIKDAALAELERLVRIYHSALGPLGEEQPGPAVKVTKGDKEVILYLPDKVEYIIRK
ncbi:MAG: hypothetical protein KBT67_05615 [bacterium]|nr:hypothetical protein [Candidatus Limimorpha caballi]